MMESLPAAFTELAKYDQFFIYRIVANKDGRNDKIPCDIHGNGRGSDDPGIWVNAETALAAVYGPVAGGSTALKMASGGHFRAPGRLYKSGVASLASRPPGGDPWPVSRLHSAQESSCRDGGSQAWSA